MARAGNVVLAADWSEVQDQGYVMTQWNEPAATLAGAVAAVGVARLPLDPDGRLRRATLVFQDRPSLALAAARLQPGFHAPVDLGTRRLVNFNGDSRLGIRTVSYYQALDPDTMLPPGLFKDAIILVGSSQAASADLARADLFLTPYKDPYPGVEIQATILDSLLRDRFILEPFSTFASLAALGALLAALCVLVFYRVGAFTGLGITVGLGAVLIVGSAALQAGIHVRVPVVAPVVTVVAAFGFTYLYRFLLGITERRMILGAFKHYLAPAIVDRILKDPGQLRLGGAAYEDVSILFTDLAGFSTISEKLSPEKLHDLLTEYFREMLPIIVLDEKGTFDKFIGDAIMAYFGCPLAQSSHALQACRSALRMQARLRELNAVWKAKGLPELRMRIGLNSGPVVAGNMGTESIFNYTILGDNVNLASRLEGVNKEYGTLTIASEDTWQKAAGGAQGRELDCIRVKGKSAPVAIYEVAALPGELPPRTLEVFTAYGEGLRAYRERRWTEAVALFEGILRDEPQDGPSVTMKSRAEEYARNPPPEDWDGVYTMLHK
jgi:adenylate cyclase